MPGYSTIIVDDEPDAGKLLLNLLEDFPAVNVLHVYTDALKALNTVIDEKPDIVFLDIEMPGINGIEFLQQLNNYSPQTKVVFVTAYENYALDALHNSAFDFLCKPVSRAELRRVVFKLVDALKTVKSTEQGAPPRVLLKTLEGHHYISPEEVLFLEAESNYTKLVLRNKRRILSSINLGKVQELFPDVDFVRISRKHVINKNYLTFMNFSKKYCVVAENGEEFKLDVSVKMRDLKKDLEK